ncbi:hypothetical protein Q2T42_07725 [Leptolyngbya boryana CZ1]|jgi:predicted RNase H-like HicB family nuclease|uniref:Uncharacterized protein n=2 Tax=Leptolyngbya boryana TaxID=1184 RepID=A0A1Z4JNA3_LEPBY|nr:MULTISPECIES: hypothetical protein [Leptolyngbya]BAY58245.1 hypothetical protein NIES2135_51180 [Leptolyngbya boryana NIES-2135]MBD2367920.1 hypothetical protein [Leptolyngbya sp. FACHB-161]MBD2374444.1 hypothetical protein [Leptolyngbya sp. FACHB-238]MBD2398866.1 hypothetical protein [Leptolyngbya sp. FACHB-239]MBD2405267.1 hypothetical protein [Leptolyngbya sp. FACHB-402]
MDVTLLIKSLESGQYEASVLELPAYRVEAASRELAIEALKTALLDHVKDAEAFTWQLPIYNSDENPAWLNFAGIFKDNADFAEIVEEIQAARESWGDEEMDESEYSR